MKLPNRFPLLSYIIIGTLACVVLSCKKFVEPEYPNDQLNSNVVFKDSATARAAIAGLYSEMITNNNLFTNVATTVYCGMSADELYYYFPSLRDEFVKNEISRANHITINNGFWQLAYRLIYASNLSIEKISSSTSLSIPFKNQLLGEAKFVRAYCYFYLVNLFGDVPLTTTSNYQENSIAPRTSASKVYAQIVSDLKDSKSLLSNQYVTGEKVRPNRWAAIALLSRAYLYTGDWNNAEIEATSIISSGTYQLETDLNGVFLKNSTEAIWQLRPVRPDMNTYEAQTILPASPFSPPGYLITQGLLNSFETGDMRKGAWVKSRTYGGTTVFYPFKYKVYRSSTPTEYYMMLRLAEQYLIRAEARARLGRIQGALSDLNVIRSRAGLPNSMANDQPSLAAAIEQERRIELFCEWGHRWFDLKRTQRADAVLGSLKTPFWQPTDALWPIPQDQILLNPALSQNPGYN